IRARLGEGERDRPPHAGGSTGYPCSSPREISITHPPFSCKRRPTLVPPTACRRRLIQAGPGPPVPRDSRALRQRHHPVVELLVEDDLPSGKAVARRSKHEFPYPLPVKRNALHRIAPEMRREDEVSSAVSGLCGSSGSVGLEDVEGGTRETPGAEKSRPVRL